MPSSPLQRLAAVSLLALGGLGAASSAWAQEVELYNQARFKGNRLRISTDAPDVSAYGLGGGIGSVVVKSGQWEFCTAPQYGGACITVGPGRYSEMPPALRGTVASVRRADTAHVQPVQPVPPHRGTPMPVPVPPPMARAGNEPLVLFDGPDGSGRALSVTGPVGRLNDANFNDAAASVLIRRGQWQLCERSDFRGDCVTLDPGRHNLNGRYARKVSSIRPVAGTLDAPVTTNPWLRPHTGAGGDAVVLFEHTNFDGRQLGVSATVARLGDQGFNDNVSSVLVQRGRWQICEHADFGGQCLLLGPGRHVLDAVFNDRVSSIRPVLGTTDQPFPRGGGLVLYEFPDLSGRQAIVTDAVNNLKSLAMNDVATALEVLSGQWELCTDADFGGQCVVVRPGRYQLDATMRDRISSVRPR